MSKENGNKLGTALPRSGNTEGACHNEGVKSKPKVSIDALMEIATKMSQHIYVIMNPDAHPRPRFSHPHSGIPIAYELSESDAISSCEILNNVGKTFYVKIP